MSEMVERVARAIYEAANRSGEYVGAYRFPRGTGSTTTLDGQFDLNELARAAIEAMREPTEGMIYAGVYDPFSLIPPMVRQVWHNMIDAALQETTPSPTRK